MEVEKNIGEQADVIDFELIGDLAQYIRKQSFETILTAQSGHLGGSSSSAELLSTLYFGGQFNFDPNDSLNENRDRVLIRGHEGPIRYPIFSLIGYFSEKHLSTYRELGSLLQGHEEMDITPGVDLTPSGSLGMLLSYGVGASISFQERNMQNKVIVFLGDGEEQEGQIGEAARHASSYGVDNLICVIDKNEKQLSRETETSDNAVDLEMLWKGYGWEVLKLADGHSITDIYRTYEDAKRSPGPVVIIAETVKGKYLPGAEGHFNGYHTIGSCDDATVQNGIDYLKEVIDSQKNSIERIKKIAPTMLKCAAYDKSCEVETDVDSRIIDVKLDNVLGLEVWQYLRDIQEEFEDLEIPFYVLTPDFISLDSIQKYSLGNRRLIDVGIREQHAVSMAYGISKINPKSRIFLNMGDAFIYRALDQLNAATQGESSLLIAGQFSGIGQDRNGKSHQSSGQPGAVMSIPGIKYYEPCDRLDMYNVFNKSLGENSGITYARLHRKHVPLLERNVSDRGNINNYTVHESDRKPDIVIASNGFTLSNAVESAKALELKHGIASRVINLVSPSMLDDSFTDKVEDGKPLLTVYNGSHSVLKSLVAAKIMDSDGARPVRILGHGFSEGTSGRHKDLEAHFALDKEGIEALAINAVRTTR